MGDPAGVGGELTVAAWSRLRANAEQTFFAIDDPARLEALGAPTALIEHPSEAATAFAHALPVLPERLPSPAALGAPEPEHAAAVVRSIERAVAAVQSGAAGAVVTNPINKKALYDGVGFAHPGHTEFLADLAGVAQTVMMLVGRDLRVVPTTIHIPLADAPAALTPDLLEGTLRITHAALIDLFDVSAPQIAVSGLNPHAGESGAMGREEITLITPVLQRLRAEGMDLRGPMAGDTMFHEAARASYDAAVCMYHDQALIPLKTLDFWTGVNVTLGLPFIRTSPDHGVAYDIAGSGRADPSSLIAAIGLAAELREKQARRP